MQTDICSFFFVKASSGGLFYLLFFPNLKGVKVLKLPLLVGLILLEKIKDDTVSLFVVVHHFIRLLLETFN